MPYDRRFNADYMLCNAFSREIPPPTRSLLQWLTTLPPRELGSWELSDHDLDARAFYPRVLIGEYLEHEFHALCEQAEALGHHIDLHPETAVTDIIPSPDLIEVETHTHGALSFDHVIIATGHVWPQEPRIDRAQLVSPWPYTAITSLPARNIGILGSSLSAIDIVMALAFTHGTFNENGDTVTWQANPETAPLKITMLSKMGIMPEADFYYPFPYQPLKVFTPEAVRAEMSHGSAGLLSRLFALFRKELQVSDPDYVKRLELSAETVRVFSEAYFRSRRQLGGLEAVKKDFTRARASMRNRETIAYRYTLLRAHENFDLALRALNEDDWHEFQTFLLPVFSDCYAAVPHLSIARIIALHDSGVLHLKETGDDARFCNTDAGGVEVSVGEDKLSFDAMIDARGQAAAPLAELPFSRLVQSLSGDQPVTAPFALKTANGSRSRVYCLAMPQLLERHPFSQGLVNCDENAGVVAEDLLRRIKAR